jgi:hypothetical protein
VRRSLFLGLLAGVFGLASCHGTPAVSTAVVCTTTTSTTSTTSSTSSCTDPVTGISVTIAPATISLNVTTSSAFQAAVSGGTNTIITWQVNKITHGNSTVGTIDSSGNYIAPAVLPSPATVNVTAVSYEDPNVSATATVTILPPPTVTISPTSWTLTAGVANTKTFTATVTGAATTNADWEVNGILGGNDTFGKIDFAGVYTTPLTPPLGSIVTVTAVSHDFPTVSASATVTISGYSTSSLQGPFAFSMSGRTASGAFFRAGSFVADGAGHLTGGLEDINDASGPTAIPISFVGTYTIAADGRGAMQFNDGRTPSNFNFVLVNNNQLQIIGFDTAGTATGQANLQDLSAFSASALNGTHVFDFTGVDNSSNPLSQIGEFTTDGQSKILGGLLDINDNGAPSPASITGGSYAVTSSTNGRGTATIVTSVGSLQFNFYIVSRGSTKFVGMDATQRVAGVSAQQNPNATFDLTSLTGNYAFLLAGSGAGGSMATAGSFSADGGGNLAGGALDENVSGTPNTNVVFSGSYTVAATGRGTASFSGGRTYVFYLGQTGNAVFQETDSNHPNIASDGLFTQQQSAAFSLASIQGNYAIGISGLSGSSAQVIAGQLNADGAGSVPSGAIDINTAGTLTPGETISGTYAASSSPERGTLALNLLNPLVQTRTFAVYVVSSTQVFVVGTDTGSLAAGALFRQF